VLVICAFLGLHSFDYWFFGVFAVVLVVGIAVAAYLEDK
jgi:hypothetical protein